MTPQNRKRSFHDRDAASDSDTEISIPAIDDSSPKRLRNRQGSAVHRRTPLRYDVHALLNNLAFTRLHVTSNFHRYSHGSSPVVLCIISDAISLYSALW